jgi:hypothetical protein
MTLRFVGTELQIGFIKLQAFGQSIELDAATAKELIAHTKSSALLSEDAFASIGFTAEELRWANSDAFQAKRKLAWAALEELRVRLRAGGDFEKPKTNAKAAAIQKETE